MRAPLRSAAVALVVGAVAVVVVGACGSADNGGVITPRTTITSPGSPTTSNTSAP